MDLPARNSEYGLKDYWDTRYKTEEHFDWFADYSAFRHLITGCVESTDTILTLGCGNSSLSEDMYKDGFKKITNTDYSEVVIENMKAKTAHMREMRWEVMDIYDLTYSDDTYDVILEKGTLDALLVDEKDPWRMSEESLSGMDGILTNVSRILKPGGRFVSITFAQPHFRAPIYALDKYNWSIKTEYFGDTFHYYYFTMTKGEALSSKDIAMSGEYFERLRTPLEIARPASSSSSEDEDFLLNVDCDL